MTHPVSPCHHTWLGKAADEGYRAFCPNVFTLDEMRDRQVHLGAQGGHPCLDVNAGSGILKELEEARGQTL